METIMFDKIEFDSMDDDQQSELKEFDPNYLMGIAAVDKTTEDKMYFYMDNDSRFNIAMVDKESGDSMSHSFSLVEACKVVYILQSMFADYIDLVTDGDDEEDLN